MEEIVEITRKLGEIEKRIVDETRYREDILDLRRQIEDINKKVIDQHRYREDILALRKTDDEIKSSLTRLYYVIILLIITILTSALGAKFLL